MSGQIRLSQDGAVLTVSIKNPPFNFLTAGSVQELEQIFRRADRDRAIRVVVLASAVPGVFVGHYDIDEILASTAGVNAMLSPGQAAVPLALVSALHRIPALRAGLDRGPLAGVSGLLRFHRVVRGMMTSGTVFVAAIGGPALGGGFELAAASDVRLLSEGDYEIGLLETTLGLIPGGAGAHVLTRALGASVALEALLEARSFNPKEALECGLAHRVVDPDALLEEARRTAQRLARRSPEAVRALKRAVHDPRSLGRSLARERADFLSLASRPQAREALEDYAGQLRRRAAAGGGLPAVLTEDVPAWRAGTVAAFAQ